MKNNPGRTTAFYEGYEDFVKGKLSNRYSARSQYAKEWQHGQDVAYTDQLKYNKEHGI